MVQVKVTGKRAEQLIAQQARQRTQPAAPVETDTLVFHVRTKSDAEAVAAHVGMSVPVQRGRFPIRRLAEALASKGHRLDTTEYAGDPVSTIPATYRVTLMEMHGNDIYPRTGLVTGDQVREFHSGRGRASVDAMASAAIDAHEWGPEYMEGSVTVTRLD